MRAAWLLRDGDVLAAAEIAERRGDRARRLMGCDGYEGALFLPGAVLLHTAMVRFPLDVAFVDNELVVVATVRVGTWRIALPRRHARGVLAARAGSFDRWGLAAGDRLEIREAQ